MSSLLAVEDLLQQLTGEGRRVVFIGGMGFEARALAAIELVGEAHVKGAVIGVRYPRGVVKNREEEFRRLVHASGTLSFQYVGFSADTAYRFEIDFDRILKKTAVKVEDVVVLDVSGLTKFLILVCLMRLWDKGITVSVVMTTARQYAPTKEQFEKIMEREGGNVRVVAGQPTSGASTILRSPCLVSARMQGQPACAVAFTSFNEELIRHAVGTVS